MAKRPRHNYQPDLDRMSQLNLPLDQDLLSALSNLRQYIIQLRDEGTGQQTLLQMAIKLINLMVIFVPAHCQRLMFLTHQLNGQSRCKRLHGRSGHQNREKNPSLRSEFPLTQPRKAFLCRRLGPMADQRQWMEPTIGRRWKLAHKHKHKYQQHRPKKRSLHQGRRKAVLTR